MQCGTITVTVSTVNTDNFDLYSDADGYGTPFATGISRATLQGGYYTEFIPDLATIIRVQSNAACTNYVDVVLTPLPSPTPTPMPTIVLSMGSTQVITNISDEYEVWRIINHTPHAGSQTISIDMDYWLGVYALASYATLSLYWNKNGGSWNLIDSKSVSTITSSTTDSGSFTIPGVTSSDVIRLRSHSYAYASGDDTYTEFYINSGTVTSGYGPVSVGSPSDWSFGFYP